MDVQGSGFHQNRVGTPSGRSQIVQGVPRLTPGAGRASSARNTKLHLLVGARFKYNPAASVAVSMNNPYIRANGVYRVPVTRRPRYLYPPRRTYYFNAVIRTQESRLHN